MIIKEIMNTNKALIGNLKSCLISNILKKRVNVIKLVKTKKMLAA
jgi:hypothetical protein